MGNDNLNELPLYHGTDHSAVDGICAQNFDWRLSNAFFSAAYGKGSYFARDASYSHDYTTKDAENFRCMFMANVLTGKYTKVITIRF